MTKDNEQLNAVSRLVALRDIHNLKARYWRCMDTKDWGGLENVFSEDAVFDLRQVESVRDPVSGEWSPPFGGEDRVFRGRPRVMDMIRRAVTRLVTVHHGHMGEIEILSDNTARAIWAMEDLIRSAPGEPTMQMHGFGHYHDDYVGTEDGWRIARTRITRLRLDRD